SNPAPPLAKVSGTVTLDGKAMQGGEVRFNSTGYPAKVLEIKDGAFSGEVYSGKNRVEVVWDKDGPPVQMDPNQPPTPTKINAVDPIFSGPTSPFTPEIPKTGAS